MTMLKEKVEKKNFLTWLLGLEFISTMQLGNYSETNWYFKHGEAHCYVKNGVATHAETGVGHVFRFVVRMRAKISNFLREVYYLD